MEHATGRLRTAPASGAAGSVALAALGRRPGPGWYSEESLKDPEGWAEAQNVADGIMSGEIENPVPGATHYKTKAVKPAWAKKKYAVATVGSHNFYALPEAEVAHVVSNAAPSRYRGEPPGEQLAARSDGDGPPGGHGL